MYDESRNDFWNEVFPQQWGSTHTHDIRPPYFEMLIRVIGGIKHQRALIHTLLRAVAISAIPLTDHLLILNLKCPVKNVCVCVWCVCVCVGILVGLIESSKGLLHPIFAKFLFYLASISLQADRTHLVLRRTAEWVCVWVCVCACFEGDVLNQSPSDVSYITFIAAVWP